MHDHTAATLPRLCTARAHRNVPRPPAATTSPIGQAVPSARTPTATDLTMAAILDRDEQRRNRPGLPRIAGQRPGRGIARNKARG
jgi:hypothetical protein